ncbi:putative NADPH dehydrogenase [Candida viswanathii]|uniref:Putative NADPH dehydrogenase n=1 Tax=Candida viswanathii TaxID=5486 RepID=A0A367YKU4_9ASCO|nr:putative NADPH dehydrogenase [Candida viswanathii]
MTVSTPLTATNLFKPITVGNVQLGHRVVHAPTSRKRSTKDNYPTDFMIDYYKSRSRTPSSLIIFESCLIAEETGLIPHKCGLWNDKHNLALKKIVDEIHAKECYVGVQIMGNGRVSNFPLMKNKNLPVLAPSANYPSEASQKAAEEAKWPVQELTVEQIHKAQDAFVNAAVKSLNVAGFDFVELHGSSGFLIEQFLSPLSNKRTDEYGGSVANRSRFLLEIVDKFINHPDIGSAKTALRIAPWYSINGMDYPEENPPENGLAYQFSEYILKELEKRKNEGHEIAYVSIVEPRVSGNAEVELTGSKTNNEIIKNWSGKLVRSGGYATNYDDVRATKSNNIVKDDNGEVVQYASLIEDVNNDDRTLIGFSRAFTSNPDLIDRLKNNWKLEYYDRSTFYTQTGEGYLTFKDRDGTPITKFSDEELKVQGSPLV